jgi:hypothetical protein
MFGKQVKKRKMMDWVLIKLRLADFEKFLFKAKNYALTVSLWYFLLISLVAILIVHMRVWKK